MKGSQVHQSIISPMTTAAVKFRCNDVIQSFLVVKHLVRQQFLL